ncbi:hypothetical protein FA95DRAFT_1607395, partial [Auriscalpium vulgare]
MSLYTAENISDYTLATAGKSAHAGPAPRQSDEERASTHTDVEKRDATRDEDEKRDIIYVEYEDGDSANPVNFSYARKWTITLVACTFTGLSAAAASS